MDSIQLTTFVFIAADLVVGRLRLLEHVKGLRALRRLGRTKRLIAKQPRHRATSRRVNYLAKAEP